MNDLEIWLLGFVYGVFAVGLVLFALLGPQGARALSFTVQL